MWVNDKGEHKYLLRLDVVGNYILMLHPARLKYQVLLIRWRLGPFDVLGVRLWPTVATVGWESNCVALRWQRPNNSFANSWKQVAWSRLSRSGSSYTLINAATIRSCEKLLSTNQAKRFLG